MANFSQVKTYNYNWQRSKFEGVTFSGSYISQFINDVGYITASLTSSYALNALSSSYALTASYALNGGGGGSIDTSSFVTTSSFNSFTSSFNSFTSSYNTGSFTGSFVGSFSGTIGDPSFPSLYTTAYLPSSVVGSNTVATTPTQSYDSIFYDYVIKSGSNVRAGNIIASWYSNNISYTEVSNRDIGLTSGVTFSVLLNSGNAQLIGSTSTSGWSIKTIIRSI